MLALDPAVRLATFQYSVELKASVLIDRRKGIQVEVAIAKGARSK